MRERRREQPPDDGTRDERAEPNGTTRKQIVQTARLFGGVLAGMLVFWICDVCGISSHTVIRAATAIVIAGVILQVLRKRRSKP